MLTKWDFKRWYVFGESADTVDIADMDNSTLLEKVPRALAEQILKEHNAAIERLEELWRKGLNE